MGRPEDTIDERTIVHEVGQPPSAVPRLKKLPALEQVAGAGAPRKFDLEASEVVIGRSLQASISIEGAGMSRQHAAVRRTGIDYSITDLESANGLYLNGVKTHSAVLRDGDQLQMGDVVLVFHEGA